MRKRTRPGSKLVGICASLLAAALFWPVPGLAAPARKDKPLQSYAVIAGTVFRENGLSLPRAEVQLDRAQQPQQGRKFKKMKALTDSRGEFAFRVPAAPGDYELSVKAAGYQGQEKAVSVAGEERRDVFFRLEFASK